jgi:GT2 family glycosyltransferase
LLVEHAPESTEVPLTSVIIPTYNRARFLPDVLASVFAQRGNGPYEVIVVDDASSDDTAAVLQSLGPGLRCIRHERNQGVAAARATGAGAARGRFLAFHDSDDHMLPDRLATLERYLASDPDVGAVFANGVIESDDGPAGTVVPSALAAQLDGRRFGVREILRDQLPVFLQTALIRREVFEAVGGIDTSLDRHADLHLACRLALSAPTVFLDQPMFRYSLHGTNQTANRLRLREGLAVVMRRLRASNPEVLATVGPAWYRRREARHHYRIARAHFRAGRRDQAHGAIREAVALAPTSLRYRWYQWWI